MTLLPVRVVDGGAVAARPPRHASQAGAAAIRLAPLIASCAERALCRDAKRQNSSAARAGGETYDSVEFV